MSDEMATKSDLPDVSAAESLMREQVADLYRRILSGDEGDNDRLHLQELVNKRARLMDISNHRRSLPLSRLGFRKMAG